MAAGVYPTVVWNFCERTECRNFGYAQDCREGSGVAGDENIFGRVNVEGKHLSHPLGNPGRERKPLSLAVCI
jgi:hypothetical protein